MSYWEHIKQAYDKTSIYDGGVAFRYEFARLPAPEDAEHTQAALLQSPVNVDSIGRTSLRRSITLIRSWLHKYPERSWAPSRS